MKVLVVNCGSSSIKYCLFESENEKLLARGRVERIGENRPQFEHLAGDIKTEGEAEAPDHEAALRKMVELLMKPEHGVIASPAEIEAVGHRVVHGGESFVESVLITSEVKAEIEKNFPLAPLHNPPNLAGIQAAESVFPAVPHVAVFDTAFHQGMPPRAYLYALPYELYAEHGVRRYGFHGTSHYYVSERAARMLDIPYKQFRAVTCHLGNGCSMAAVKGGRSIDTTMGLTPLEGLAMGTRSGDLDPAIVLYLQRRLGMSAEQVDRILNKESGLLGLSGLSNDMRTIDEAVNDGHKRARLAHAVFAYRIRKYLGAFLAVLNGADAVVFTGGIGENDAELRKEALEDMEALGIRLDSAANRRTQGCEAVISDPASPIRVLVVPTNEEIVIARDTVRIARQSPSQVT